MSDVPASTRQVLRASTFALEGEPYVYVRARAVPRSGRHLLVTEDDLEITVATHESELVHVDLAERNADRWALLSIDCASPFYCVGFIAAICGELAGRGLDCLVVSAFTRDLVLVKDGDREHARRALTSLGLVERA